MILGRGSAKTDKAVIAEYHQFLRDHEQQENPEIYKRLFGAPEVMLNRIGKPILQWSDDELLKLYANRTKTTGYTYSCFLAFLFFRGYRRGTIYLLSRLPIVLTRCFRKALLPHRQRIQQACKDLHYNPVPGGAELNLLIWLLAVTGKTMAELTRVDFDLFQSEYQKWYQQSGKRTENRPNARLSRLERYLVHWGVIPAAKFVFQHEKHFALLQHEPIRQAILIHMKWCDGKYVPSSIHSRRATLISFFLWLQECYPDCNRLDQVTRLVALEYSRHLTKLVEEHKYSLKYRNDLYRGMRLFFDFVIDEQLDTSPSRNPFGRKDLPYDPDPVPRYIADRELRLVLDYCKNGASLKEKTVVITLLHTGLRAAELAALSKSDIIQIQGKWKIHVKKGKGLKDRVIPLTQPCLETLQTWQESGWEKINDSLFTRFGRAWQGAAPVCTIVREIGIQLGIQGLTPHRFRHTFAVSLLNYGMRESALQKLMGHTTLNMTLEYARILDHTVEEAFNKATTAMQVGPLSWVPSFFSQQDYSIFNEVDAVNWIRLPHGYCRRNPQLHCESDVKCLLCERFRPSAVDRFRLQEMYQQYLKLEMPLKADIVLSQIRLLENQVNEETQDCFPDRCGTTIRDFGKIDDKSTISIAQPLGV
jgi:integrase